MKKLIVLLLAILLFSCKEEKSCPALDVRFSPNGGVSELVVQGITEATTSIHMAAYSFTSDKIANALISAHHKGVDVEMIIDGGDGDKNPLVKKLRENNITVRLDREHAIAHNKVIIIDGKTVLTGSSNFTKAADERNGENCIRIEDVKTAELYEANWELHQSHSKELL